MSKKSKLQKMSNTEYNNMQNKLVKKSKLATYFAFAFGCVAILSSISIPFLSGMVANVFMASFLTSVVGMTTAAVIGAKAEKKYAYNCENRDTILGSYLNEDVTNYCIERTNETKSLQKGSIKQEIELEEDNQNNYTI